MNTFPKDVESVLGELRAVRAQAEHQLSGNTYFATVNRLDELTTRLEEAQSAGEASEQVLRAVVFEMDGIRARQGLRMMPETASAADQAQEPAEETATPEPAEDRPTGNAFYMQAATAALAAGEAAREAGMSVQAFARSVAEKSGETAHGFAEAVAGQASEVASAAVESAREVGIGIGEFAQSVAEKTGETAQSWTQSFEQQAEDAGREAVEEAQSFAESVEQQASETAQQAGEAAQEAAEEAQSWTQSVAEKTGETAQSWAQSFEQQAEEAGREAVEEAQSFAESVEQQASETAQEAGEAAQEATEAAKSWTESARDTAERYIQPSDEPASGQPARPEEPVEQPEPSQAAAPEQPSSPPVSDLSGMRIDTAGASDATAGPAQHADATGEAAAAQAREAGQAEERSEGAVSRFFRALFGRKS